MWLADDYRRHRLGGQPFPDSWVRLPRQCPGCGKDWLVDPGSTDAGTPYMAETDAGSDGLVLEVGCGYRPAAGEPEAD